MQHRKLGRSGLDVSVVGLGCNNFGSRADLEASRATVHKALDLGITLFDTADMYSGRGGSEIALGKILGARRKEIVLASKFGMAMDDAGHLKGASRRYIMSAVEASLQRLQTDWLDLYQLHRPDAETPMDETLRALDDLVRDAGDDAAQDRAAPAVDGDLAGGVERGHHGRRMQQHRSLTGAGDERLVEVQHVELFIA